MRRSPSRRFRARLALEILEDRFAPAIFTVTTTADDNNGATNGVSLREAILSANNSVGADTINFNIPDSGIPGSSVRTISPTSPLPTITGPTTVDGYSQPESSANTLAVGNDAVLLIELNGAGAGSAHGLVFTSGANIVRGLVVNHFSGNGLLISGAGGNSIEGNFIGTNAAGTADLGNLGAGIFIQDTPNNTIGGTSVAMRNVLSGNENRGMILSGSGAIGNVIQGNFVGTNAAGTVALGNSLSGIFSANGASANTYGGTAPGTRNVISGNAHNGIQLDRNSNDNIVQGNYLGTDVTGMSPLGNNIGVAISKGSSGNLIGGASEAARNVISGNITHGILITTDIAFGGTTGPSNNLVQGNYIGLATDGTSALGNVGNGVSIVEGSFENTVTANHIMHNGATGVLISGSSGNLLVGNRVLSNGGIGVSVVSSSSNIIGGSAASDRNLISGNLTGVSINTGSYENVVKGNWLGVDASGTVAMPNAFDGVTIATGSHDNTIGGPSVADRNVIAGNNGLGIQITTDASGNLAQNNYIGADANGGALGNGVGRQGVGIFNNADNNSILDNLILANSRSGISVAPANSTGNTFYRNRIIGNGWVPIDLQIFSNANQVTLNDLGDGDTGANNYQNFPFIAGVNMLGPDTFISGSLYSTPSTNFRLEFFAADALSPSGHRQAQYVLGTLDVTTDATGLATFVFEYSGSLPGPIVTATATNLATGDTSEFFNPSAPTNITLSNQTLQENAGANALVGNLATTDPDLGDAHTYALVSGAGDTDNALFILIGDQLRAVSSLNYEDGSTRSIRIRTTDLHGLTFDKVFTITIVDENETPTITSGNFTVPENTTAAGIVTASDPDSGATLAFSLVGGADQARFSINAATGALTFNAAPDFEIPADAGGNNVYDVTVQVSDGAISVTQALTVTITGVNDAPAITSNGGGDTAALVVAENTTAVTTVTAVDPDVGAALTFAISGGADADRFTIDANTGALRFITVPDFEAPTDANVDNLYEVLVQVSDGALTDIQTITVTVADVVEDEPPVYIGQGCCDPTALVIQGTDGNDKIRIVPQECGGDVKVLLNGTAYFFAAGSFTSIAVFGNGGDDRIVVAGAIDKPACLFGGDGNDCLQGGAGDDIVIGGAGDDLLIGRKGRDLLIGGAGADRIVGNADDDILIAGTTDHDGNQEALCAIMAEWTRCDLGYAQRVAHLRQGGGRNGVVTLTDATVHDDGCADRLTGSAGRDWYFANLDCGVRDCVTDDHDNEFVADLD